MADFVGPRFLVRPYVGDMKPGESKYVTSYAVAKGPDDQSQVCQLNLMAPTNDVESVLTPVRVIRADDGTYSVDLSGTDSLAQTDPLPGNRATEAKVLANPPPPDVQQLDPEEDIDAHLTVATVLRDFGDFDGEQTVLRSLVSRFPEDETLVPVLALSYRRRGDFGGYERVLREHADKGNVHCVLDLTAYLEATNRVKDAFRILSESVRRPQFLLDGAELTARLLPEASTQMPRRTATFPTKLLAQQLAQHTPADKLRGMAKEYQMSSAYQAAANILQALIQHQVNEGEPTTATDFRALSTVHTLSGNDEWGREALRIGIRFGHTECAFWLASSLREIGDNEGARQALDKAEALETEKGTSRPAIARMRDELFSGEVLEL